MGMSVWTGNTHLGTGEGITVQLTSCFTCCDLAALLMGKVNNDCRVDQAFEKYKINHVCPFWKHAIANLINAQK